MSIEGLKPVQSSPPASPPVRPVEREKPPEEKIPEKAAMAEDPSKGTLVNETA
jgi:hypothetical protein